MYLGFNELSIHGQVPEHGARAALQRVLDLRNAADQSGVVLHVRRDLLARPICAGLTLQEVLLSRLGAQDNLRRLLLRWLTKEGPFLDDEREHGASVWFECGDEVVTDWTLAEIAHRSAFTPTAAASLRPSSMDGDPLIVTRIEDGGERVELRVRNYTEVVALRAWLASCESPMRSWSDLNQRARTACPSLTFAEYAFKPLADQPFHPGVADRLMERLRVLESLRRCFSPDGTLLPAGHELRQNHFMGDKAWFSDSSDTEKQEFARDLTFPHPAHEGEFLFCPWHGKVKTPQMRIHYSEPVTAEEPVYVVYVGPKITKTLTA
jgi:hypothetical protein